MGTNSKTAFDVIVVGAGPAGLGACLTATALGLKTALIERRKTLAPIARACSEGLLYEEPYNGDAISVEKQKGLITFAKSSLVLHYTGEVKQVPSFVNISSRGYRMKIVRNDHKPIHLVFDKGRYLQENLDAVLRAGVSFYSNQTVTGIDTSEEEVTVTTNRQSFSSRFLIGADGHNSLCARLAGFNIHRKFYGTLTAACWHIKGYEPDSPDHLHLLEGKTGVSIVCLCPRVEEAEYNMLIGGYVPAISYEEKLEQVKNSSVLSNYFTKNFQVMRRLSCVLNLFHPLENPCRNNIFIVGDAAWMGQTSNTHAALTGAKAAECIAGALRQKKRGEAVYESYRAWWKQNFLDYMTVPGGGNIFEELTAGEIDELFSLMPDKIEASMEPKKAQQLLGAFFQGFIPRVQKQNPGLVQKIMTIQQKGPEEAWKEKKAMGFPVRT